MITITKDINNNIVEFAINDSSDEWAVDFKVNDSYSRSELSKRDKIAITKWILSTWKEVKEQHNLFVCFPALDEEEKLDDDISIGEVPSWRAKIYSKMGFTPEDYGTFVDYLRMTYVHS